MKRQFCEYCGSPLSDGCSCEREAVESRNDFIEEYESRADVCYGWSQQDAIDSHRFEQ